MFPHSLNTVEQQWCPKLASLFISSFFWFSREINEIQENNNKKNPQRESGGGEIKGNLFKVMVNVLKEQIRRDGAVSI